MQDGKNNEILYGNLVENITDGVLVTGIDGTIRLVNHTAAEMRWIGRYWRIFMPAEHGRKQEVHNADRQNQDRGF